MSKASISKFFAANFPTLSESDIDALTSISSYVNTPKKKIIIEAGTFNDSAFFLIEGMIRGFFINENGEEKNIFLRPEKTITGAPECLLKREPTKYTFEAMPRSKYIHFSKRDLDNLMLRHSNIRDLWLNSMYEIILTLIGRVESLIDRNPERRYEELLKTSPTFFQKAYNKHIANYLGMTSVSLSRNNQEEIFKKELT